MRKRGLSAEERAAYWLAWARILEAERDRVEMRLSEALAHAGASFQEYTERGDVYVVRYIVDGRSITSTIRQDDLTVMTAGICLAGVFWICHGENNASCCWLGRWSPGRSSFCSMRFVTVSIRMLVRRSCGLSIGWRNKIRHSFLRRIGGLNFPDP